MTEGNNNAPLSAERLEKALITAARIALLWGNEFDFGPMLDILEAALQKAREDNQFVKASAILAKYRNASCPTLQKVSET